MVITYSNGLVLKSAVIVIWEDNHTERRGNWYRAFWAASPDANLGSPVIGYCSPGGSHRSVVGAAREALKLHPGQAIYRNEKPVQL